MYLHSFIATLEHYTGQMKQSRKDDKHQGRKLINPAGGYPANIHRISTLIGHKPDLDAHWHRWISTGGIYDFPAHVGGSVVEAAVITRLKFVGVS